MQSRNMAGRNDDSHNKTSRLNTPRGSAGSSRQREHKSYVRGRYASLDASSVNGSWAQRAAEARRANEERARRTGKTSEYEQRAREARNRQFDEQPASSARSYEPVQRERSRQTAEEPLPWERPDEDIIRSRASESSSRERSSSIYDQNDSVSRLFEQRERSQSEYGSSERSISSYEREARLRRWREQVERQEREDASSGSSQDAYSARSERRTVKLGARPELDYQHSPAQDYDDAYEQDYDQDISQDFEQSYDAGYGSDYGSDYYQEEYDEEYDDDSDDYYDSGFEQDTGLVGRVHTIASDAAGAVRASSVRARIIGGAIIVIIIAAILYILFAGGGQVPSTTQSTKASSSASTSSAASSKGVADPWIEGGVFTTGDAELDKYVKDLCDAESSKNASAAENAYKGYIAVAWSNYSATEGNQNPQGNNWTVEYAKRWFANEKSGNYYEFAAVTQYVLRYFGYTDARAEACLVELENGEWANHGLVFVTDITNGQGKVCDDALGTNGWMLDIDALNYKNLDAAQNS